MDITNLPDEKLTALLYQKQSAIWENEQQHKGLMKDINLLKTELAKRQNRVEQPQQVDGEHDE